MTELAATKKIECKKPFVLWFTGHSGAGKSTLADFVFAALAEKNLKLERLDGDTVRDIFPKTGFSRDERDQHVKRVGFIASMLERNGISVIASFISPYRDSRKEVRGMCDNFIEVFVYASIEECEKRDVKGLYEKARKGEISNFTGLDDPYEEPENPEIKINTENLSVEESAAIILNYIEKYI